MTERKAGPVRPPVIDLSPREGSATPDMAGPVSSDTASGDSQHAVPPPPIPPTPPRPPARLAMPWSAIAIAGVLGAVLGIAGTYAVGSFLALPSHAPVIADPAPALAAQAARLDALEAAIPGLEDTAKQTSSSVDAVRTQLETSVTELRGSISEVRSAIPALPAPVDLQPLEARLAQLATRVDATAAGASSADAGALAQNLSTIQQQLGELGARLDGFDQRLGAQDTTVAALGRDVASTRSAVANQTQSLGGADVSPAVRLPLVLSGLETAFAMGRPFANELQSLVALLPDLAVPEPVNRAAPDGLVRPDALSAELESVLPDMLAANAQSSTGDWAEDALAWAKAILAIRPTGEITGDTPDAVMSRLEAAVNRHDYIAAETLLGQLPAPMQTAAGTAGDAIRTHAAADRLVADLRAQALSPAPTASETPAGTAAQAEPAP